jgi:single-stranded DNA-binding protein
MSIAESVAQNIIVFVGSIYQDPATSYTVDGGYDITFTSAPPNTVPINVIHTSI